MSCGTVSAEVSVFMEFLWRVPLTSGASDKTGFVYQDSGLMTNLLQTADARLSPYKGWSKLITEVNVNNTGFWGAVDKKIPDTSFLAALFPATGTVDDAIAEFITSKIEDENIKVSASTTGFDQTYGLLSSTITIEGDKGGATSDFYLSVASRSLISDDAFVGLDKLSLCDSGNNWIRSQDYLLYPHSTALREISGNSDNFNGLTKYNEGDAFKPYTIIEVTDFTVSEVGSVKLPFYPDATNEADIKKLKPVAMLHVSVVPDCDTDTVNGRR